MHRLQERGGEPALQLQHAADTTGAPLQVRAVIQGARVVRCVVTGDERGAQRRDRCSRDEFAPHRDDPQLGSRWPWKGLPALEERCGAEDRWCSYAGIRTASPLKLSA
jgi:hypothetical protein